MTHPHEHEDRELVSQMERALATAVSTGAALIEAFMRRHQLNAERIAREAQQESVATGAANAGVAFGQAATQARQAVDETRHALGVGQSDPTFWQTASEAAITDKIRADYGADPTLVGDRAHDRHWVTRADAGEILDVYESARRWSHASLAAEQLADNIGELLDEYGVDVDLVASLPREEAAELVATSRAGHYARPDVDDERTVDDITRLIDDRDSALDTADRDAAAATSDFDLGDDMARTAEVLEAAVSAPHADASHAAALAVDDHPTRPGTAAKTSRKTATKARPGSGRGRAAGSDRGHDGR
ncbi:hypothetical protein ACQ7HM_21120 [Williamsia sp. MIQD14]|uniref:hypothetical protein n=1 Tax=Williamsia sp. MIQD14 TaxID=3425703 RepID=UPI003DA18A09